MFLCALTMRNEHIYLRRPNSISFDLIVEREKRNEFIGFNFGNLHNNKPTHEYLAYNYNTDNLLKRKQKSDNNKYLLILQIN